MLKSLLPLLILITGAFSSLSAGNDVLFTIDDTKVYTSEFEYIYQKNNFNNKADYSRKSLEDYLNLYVNFRLKVKQALEEGLDKNERFVDELSAYEKQLLDSYADKSMLEKLVRQEYDRSQNDVLISHIFIQTADNNWEKALADANSVYKKLKDGLSFEDAARQFSNDKQTAEKGGRIGWLNSYQMTFPEIEEVAYAMKAGEYAAPVKTRLGYHIIKLNETRPARPKIKVAIIKRYLPLKEAPDSIFKSVEDTIRLVYAKLKSNEPFDKLVQRYSQDELSKSGGGQMEWFGINTFAKVFEDAAYALKDGEFSAPVKTSTAWYIIKRMETAKPLSYEASVPLLKSKLQNSAQYQYELDKFVAQLKQKYAVKEWNTTYPDFKQRLSGFSTVSPYAYRDTASPAVLLQIGEKTYNENDFGKKIQSLYYSITPKQGTDRFEALIEKAAQAFILDYYREDIKANNQEYKMLMDEYKNGIMIFALSEKNIWNKATEDSAGLLKYYNEHKTDFNLKKRATVRTVYAQTSKQANALYKMIAADKGITDEMILEKMKSLGISEPKLTSDVTEAAKSTLDLSKEYVLKPQASAGQYRIVQVSNVLPERSRTFDECRGYVVAAYQEFLEKQWVSALKEKYNVVINTPVLEAMVRK
jgi:peptidyl-prolyl cis-trans isomerase SurA